MPPLALPPLPRRRYLHFYLRPILLLASICTGLTQASEGVMKSDAEEPPTSLRACESHRGRPYCSYLGTVRAPEAGEGAGGAPFRGGSEEAQEHYFRGVRSGERDRVRAVSRRSPICVRSLWMSVSRLFETGVCLC